MPGYDRSRIVGESEEVLEEFICGICLGVLIKPTVTQCCGQTYCFDCINEWVEENNTCPNDREVLTTDQLKPSPKMVTNLLNIMRIKCDFNEKGCKSVVKINDLVKHKENGCVFNPSRYCDNCGDIKSNHSDKDCIKRLVTKLDGIQKENHNLRQQKDKDQIDFERSERLINDLRKENDHLKEQKDVDHTINDINIKKLKEDFEWSERINNMLKLRIEEIQKENAQFKEKFNSLLSHSEKGSTERCSTSKQIVTNVAKGDKPREQLSAYEHFVQSCREEHQKKHPNENVVFAEFSKKCAQTWKTMNGMEKSRFNLLAKEDKNPYEREMAKYMTSLPEKRKREDSYAPKPAYSAFYWFCNDVRTSVKEAMNDSTVVEVGKELQRRWNECTEAQKSKYVALADTDKARYEKELKAFAAKMGKRTTRSQMKEEYNDDDDSSLSSSSSNSSLSTDSSLSSESSGKGTN